ncbi:MAG: 50S ribosomal protein L13 [Alphaproteobacteria bacterium]|nr:50S ribosomal protein L13 [Alphaproteobacteria bacterium]
MKSFAMRVEDAPAQKKWILIDADGVILGRLAAEVATILRGKNKPTFSPSVDCGDNVIIINAEKVKLTGNKLKDKVFYYHTGYAGGIKERTMGFILSSRFPERAIQKAVQRMLPRGTLGRKQMTNLRVFKGPKHTHEAQQPVVLNFAAANPKNKRIAK